MFDCQMFLFQLGLAFALLLTYSIVLVVVEEETTIVTHSDLTIVLITDGKLFSDS